jgi:transposase InsO family protein
MKQNYHKNAKTNLHYRELIHNSVAPIQQLSIQYNVSPKTIRKWKGRGDFQDKSSKPRSIKYALSQEEQAIVCALRRSTWWPIDEIIESLFGAQQVATKRSSVYRTWVRNGINKLPEPEKYKAKQFKEYDPGYLHVDVTYLPKIDGRKLYLFVAIDRATRLPFYHWYETKSADNTVDFVNKCVAFFPYTIHSILTDNGLEFTNRRLVNPKSKKLIKPSKLDDFCEKNKIVHRCTAPYTPQTNGMVERANGIIKANTIKKESYATTSSMQTALMHFLVYFILHRRHGSLRKELQVRTPYQAVEKWYKINPNLFKETPSQFQEKVLNLIPKKQARIKEQPGET